MKKTFKTLFIAVIGTFLFGTVSCEKTTTSATSTPAPTTTPSTAVFHQYIEDEASRLKLDYKGKDFYTDGVAQVDLAYAIDGDTAHFVPKGSSTTSTALIKTRFYGVDTPESTGQVQAWGAAASAFTKEKLLEANENGTIVISAAQEDYGVPQFDSTGSRYLTLVWVNLTKKDCDFSELTFLNLWLVQEGYSTTRSVSNMPSYSQLFFDAEAQARAFELHLFSPDPDPDLPVGDYENVTLLELKREIEASFTDDTHVNKFNQKRVTVQGTVAGFSDHILYIQGFYNSENSGDLEVAAEGEYAGINVFVGMGSIPTRFSTIGAYIEVKGLAQDSEQFGFQITDTYFPQRASVTDGKASRVIYTAEEAATTEYALVTHEYNASDLKAASTEVLYCRVKINEPLTVASIYASASNNYEITLYFEGGYDFNVYLTFVYYGDSLTAWNKSEDFVGKKFNVSGVYGYHTTTSGRTNWQIIPTSAEDITLAE